MVADPLDDEPLDVAPDDEPPEPEPPPDPPEPDDDEPLAAASDDPEPLDAPDFSPDVPLGLSPDFCVEASVPFLPAAAFWPDRLSVR